VTSDVKLVHATGAGVYCSRGLGCICAFRVDLVSGGVWFVTVRVKIAFVFCT
jgi:hypothetical protein